MITYAEKSVSYDTAGRVFVIRFRAPDPEMFKTLLTAIRELPQREYNPTARRWTAPVTKETVETLKRLEFEPDISALKFFLPPPAAKPASTELEIPPELARALPKLRPYQQAGVAFLIRHKDSGLIGDSPGLGKTIQALGLLLYRPEIRPALVICPAVAKLVWEQHIPQWLPGNQATVLRGKTPYSLGTNLDVAVINYDILADWEKTLKTVPWGVVIGDEVQQVTNPKAKRTKAFIRVARSVKRRVFLSGTPINNRPSEFFTVLNLLSPKVFPNQWRYQMRYCNPKHNGFGWTFNGLTHGEELAELVAEVMIRRRKEDVLTELPPKQRIRVPMELDYNSREWETYQELEQELSGWESAKQTRDARALEDQNNLEKLKQLAYALKRKAAVNWLEDYLDSDQKLVVFATHRQVVEDLSAHFGKKAVKMYGGTSPEERGRAIDAFQKNPAIRLFIGNIRAAGQAITLTAASATCTLEFDWSPNIHIQAEDRVHRLGQTADAVFAYYLIAPRTIEERIMTILETKAAMLGQVLDRQEDVTFLEDSGMIAELLNGYK